MERALERRPPRGLSILLVALGLLPQPLSGQTIRGRLLDAENGRPIDLGVLVLLTTDGDTVGLTATNPDGRFSLTASEPGVFLLQASAFGYVPRVDAGFELGEGGRMDVEVRIAPQPMELDEILVPIDRPIFDHPLVQNGFVNRYRQGSGHFITPRDLERTVYRDTESLFYMIPGVRVLEASAFGRGARVLLRGPWGRCSPRIFVDGRPTHYDPSIGETLTMVAPLWDLEAVEIYRRPAEVPAEFPTNGSCGVIVFWTKR